MTGEHNASTRLMISIVSHSHGAMLAALLDDLALWRSPDDAIVVTLNVPEDGLERWRWPDVEWIDNPAPKGFSANHNAALIGRYSRWVAVLNPDIRIGSDVLSVLLARAQGDASIGLVAPGVVGPDGTPQDSARRLLTPVRLVARVGRRLAGRGIAKASRTRRELDWLAGMFLLIRRDAFETIGGFDTRFFLYCEDMDICIRLQLAGYRIDYARETEVIHDARRHSHRSLTHLRWHLASLVRAWLTPAFWDYWRQRRSGMLTDV